MPKLIQIENEHHGNVDVAKKLRDKEITRKKRERYKAEGRCRNCGNRELVSGKVKCAGCLEIAKQGSLKFARRMRTDAYAAYGGPICICCGETEVMFLTIDHIHGGGGKRCAWQQQLLRLVEK